MQNYWRYCYLFYIDSITVNLLQYHFSFYFFFIYIKNVHARHANNNIILRRPGGRRHACKKLQQQQQQAHNKQNKTKSGNLKLKKNRD